MDVEYLGIILSGDHSGAICRTPDVRFTGSSPGWAPLHSSLGQAIYTCVRLSPSSIIWYWPRSSDAVQQCDFRFDLFFSFSFSFSFPVIFSF